MWTPSAKYHQGVGSHATTLEAAYPVDRLLLGQ